MSGDRLTLAGVFLVIAAMAGIRAENDRNISNPQEQKEEHQVEPLKQSDEHKAEQPKPNDEHRVKLAKQNILTDKIIYKLAGQIAEFPRYSHKEKVGLAATDFDKDGNVDLVFMRVLGERGKVFLYKNDGQGNYILDGQIMNQSEQSKDTFRRVIDLAAADFDGDGEIDLAFMVNCSGGYNGSIVHLYKNQGYGNYGRVYNDKGLGSYIAEAIGYGHNEKGVGLAAADFDGDGDIELVTRVRELVTKGSPYKYTVRLFEDGGLGDYFSAGQRIEEATISSNSTFSTLDAGLAAADFDSDGDIDLAVMETSRNKHTVFLYTNEGIESLVKTQ